MCVCIFCIYFIEISFLLTDVCRYVPGLGAKQISNGKLCTLATLKTDQTGWMLIYVFPVCTSDFVGHAAAHNI